MSEERKLRRGLFVDRDGVIIEDVGLLSRRDKVKLLPGAATALQRAQQAGFAVVVVSNQTVVARGLASAEEVTNIHAWITELLQREGCAPLDAFYFCPHHPHADVAELRIHCACRKPQPGMLLRAARELDIDLTSSVMVGDRVSDIIAGQRAGCRTILLETGMHTAPGIVGADDRPPPDHVFADLESAVEALLRGVA